MVWKIIICLFGLGNFFLLNCADLTDKIDIGLDIDFINYNKNSWSKTSNALPIIFCCKMCLFWVFFILQKSCNIISLGIFFVHFTLYKSEKYMFCTLLICYQFYDLNYSRQERGDYRFIFGFSYFLFLVKGDLMGWVGGGLRMRETYIKRISFYFDRS